MPLIGNWLVEPYTGLEIDVRQTKPLSDPYKNPLNSWKFCGRFIKSSVSVAGLPSTVIVSVTSLQTMPPNTPVLLLIRDIKNHTLAMSSQQTGSTSQYVALVFVHAASLSHT